MKKTFLTNLISSLSLQRNPTPIPADIRSKHLKNIKSNHITEIPLSRTQLPLFLLYQLLFLFLSLVVTAPIPLLLPASPHLTPPPLSLLLPLPFISLPYPPSLRHLPFLFPLSTPLLTLLSTFLLHSLLLHHPLLILIPPRYLLLLLPSSLPHLLLLLL